MALHRAIILLAFAGEVCLLTIWQKSIDQGGSAWNPFWLFCVSLFIGVYPILVALYARRTAEGASYWDRLQVRIPFIHRQSRLSRYLSHPLLLFGLAAWSFVNYLPVLTWITSEIPVALSQSDIMPQIQIFVRRFLSGEFPYQPIHEFGYPLFSPYMPLHWGPYVLPQLGGFDERWLSLGVFVLAGGYFCWQVSRTEMPVLLKWVFAILPFWVLQIYLDHDLSMFAKTVELLIAGYYLFFASTLLGKSPYPQAIGLSLCLLSRYFLVFWVPLYLFTAWKGSTRQKALIIGGIGLASVLLLFVFPFYLKDPTLIARGLAHHEGVMRGNWTHDLEAGNGALYRGVGFAGYVAPLLSGEVAARLATMSWMHVLGSILTTGLLAGIYWRIRDRIPQSLFAIASFKIYLTIFYTLLPLPILYYFFVPLCVSLPVLLGMYRFVPSPRSGAGAIGAG